MRISDWSSDVCSSDLILRSSAASTMSWLMIWPPKGARPGSSGRPQLCAKARVRRMALWPQNMPSDPAHQIIPAAEIGPKRRLANCCQRAKKVEAPTMDGTVRSEENTSELQSLMHTTYAVSCLKKKKTTN